MVVAMLNGNQRRTVVIGAVVTAFMLAFALLWREPATPPSRLLLQPSEAQGAVDAFIRGGGSVMAFVFAGRRDYLELLAPHLLAARRRGEGRGVLSGVRFAVNTDAPEDVMFLESLAAAWPDFFTLRKAETVVHQCARVNSSAPSPHVFAPEGATTRTTATSTSRRTWKRAPS